MSTNTQLHRVEEDDFNLEIGTRVHTLMWQKRILNKDIAELLGIDATAVGKKLRAEQKFSIEQLRAVARKLGTSIAYLVGENPAEPNPVGPTGIEPMTSTV